MLEKELIVYLTEENKDSFLVNSRNRIVRSRFISPDPTRGVSDWDLCGFTPGPPRPDAARSGLRRVGTVAPYPIVYREGTTVIPVDNHYDYRKKRARTAGEDVDQWACIPIPRPISGQLSQPEWFSHYGSAYPIVRVVHRLPMEDYFRLEKEFPALKHARDMHIEELIREIREQRDKSLDSLADYVKTMLEDKPRLL